MKTNTNPKVIDQILNRGIVTDVLPSKQLFRSRLLSGQKLKIYHGLDPTGAQLHLSHAKNIMLLEEFRQLGHEIIILIGDFTARIGDPSNEKAARKPLSDSQIKSNVKSILNQLQPLMDLKSNSNPPRILYNSRWLAKLTLTDLIELAANLTVQQIIERDMFQERLQKNQPIHLHEFLYPLMQGYDSVAMEVDVEIGGTDQTFNMLTGRNLLKRLKNKEKFVVIVNLLENPKTGELMSMSKGTGVFIGQPAKDLYGAIMAQPDEMIKPLFVNNSRLPLEEINKLNIQKYPLEAKKKVAHEITDIFHGKKAADEAASAFDSQFKKRQLPKDIKRVNLDNYEWQLPDLLTVIGLVDSKSDARRIISQGGVKINSRPTTNLTVTVSSGDVVQVGKRNFVKIA